MVNDYADFVIEKINNKDPKFEKYYEQMHEIEKKTMKCTSVQFILSSILLSFIHYLRWNLYL